MKKLLSIILAIVLAMSVVGCGKDNADSEVPKETSPADFVYEEGDNGLKITQYIGKSDKVVVPSVIENKKVTSIENSVFAGNITLKEITLPETITRIYLEKFKNCDSLEKITCLGTVEEINCPSPSNLPSLKTMEFASIEESTISNIYHALNRCNKFDTIIINEVANFKNIDYGFMEGTWVNKPINVTIPKNVEEDYLEKNLYKKYNPDLEPRGYTLTSVASGYDPCDLTVEGVDLIRKSFVFYLNPNPDDPVNGKILSDISTFTGTDYFGEERILSIASVLYKDKTYTATFNFSFQQYRNSLDGGYQLNGDFYLFEALPDTGKMCMVIHSNEVTVNGTTYKFER